MKGLCAKCNIFRNSLHRDHIIPKWQGGSNNISNLQYICANCHEDKTLEENTSAEFKEYLDTKNKGITKGSKHTLEARKKMSERRLAYLKENPEDMKRLQQLSPMSNPEIRIKCAEAGRKAMQNPELRQKAITNSRNSTTPEMQMKCAEAGRNANPPRTYTFDIHSLPGPRSES